MDLPNTLSLSLNQLPSRTALWGKPNKVGQENSSATEDWQVKTRSDSLGKWNIDLKFISDTGKETLSFCLFFIGFRRKQLSNNINKDEGKDTDINIKLEVKL